MLHSKIIFQSMTDLDDTDLVSMSSAICSYDTFKNNFGINHKFKDYLKESCW